MWQQFQIELQSQGRGTYDITEEIVRYLRQTPVATGLVHLFVQHTSASLIICENADPLVRQDLETFMMHIAPDGDPMFVHRDEGPDDMPAHVRTVLTQNALSIPIKDGSLVLGTWQGVFLWEHRHRPHARKITLTIQGE